VTSVSRTPAELEEQLERLRYRDWFREHGALAQELVPPLGWDLRLVVAGCRVVGAARRFAAPGEWRTNVSLGGRIEPVAPPPLARTLAVSAAAAIGADLVGIDLLPTSTGYFISELNGAVDFRPEYTLDGDDVYENAVLERRAPQQTGARRGGRRFSRTAVAAEVGRFRPAGDRPPDERRPRSRACGTSRRSRATSRPAHEAELPSCAIGRGTRANGRRAEVDSRLLLVPFTNT
jgi:ribosomal protein S6--L-glutamate ligase